MGVDVISSTNVTIKDIKCVHNSLFGVLITNSKNVTLEDSGIFNNTVEVAVYASRRVTIYNNTILYSRGYGIEIEDKGCEINVLHNVVEFIHGPPIFLDGSQNNTICNNLIAHNSWMGIYIFDSNDNAILHNNITKNNQEGIRLDGSKGNTVSNNIIQNNKGCAILLIGDSNSNTISHNIMEHNGGGIGLGCGILNSLITENLIKECGQLGIFLGPFTVHNKILNNTLINNGIFVAPCASNIIQNNTVNGRPLVYLVKASNRVIRNAGEVILVNCNHITVENLTLANTSVGIEVLGGQYITIERDLFINNHWGGVYLSGSNHDKILDNIIERNGEHGIVVYGSWNEIKGNLIENNGGNGVTLRGFHIAISENVIENSWNFGIELILTKYALIKGNKIIHNRWDGIYLFGSSNDTISNNVIERNGGSGVATERPCNYDIVANNTIEKNGERGIIFLSPSHNNIIINNFIENSGYCGIDITGSYYIIRGNFIENTLGFAGVSMRGSHVIFSHNIVVDSHYTGVYSHLKYSNISDNIIEGGQIGIWLEYSTYNLIFENLIGNNKCGIYLRSSANNTIYYNNFAYNTYQVEINKKGSYRNSWDKDHTGNYWSNYNGTDLNHDGIGDIPYVINKENVDRYPLMRPLKLPIPEVIIIAPKEGKTIWTSTGFSYITLRWIGPSIPIVKCYRIYLDGKYVGNTTSTQYKLRVPVGVHRIKVVLVDNANFTQCAWVAFLVTHQMLTPTPTATATPTVTPTVTPSPTPIKGRSQHAISVQILSPGGYHIFWVTGSSAKITVKWVGTPKSKIKEYKVYLDGKCLGITTSTSYTVVTGLGSHTLKIVAIGNNGGIYSSTVTFMVINVTYIGGALIVGISAYVATVIFLRRKR